MSFDVENALKDMLSAIQGELSSDWPKVQSTVNQFIKNRKKRLTKLLHYRVTNQITEKEFNSRIEDEKLLLEAQLEAMKVVSKAVIQKAANAAIDAIEKAVKLFIKSGI